MVAGNTAKLALDHLNNGGKLGAVMPAFDSYAGVGFDAQTVNDSMAFLVGELEKIDPTLLEPLTSYTYARDIAMKEGGGWVQTVSNIAVDYATTGGNDYGLQAPSSNEISRVQANLEKGLFKTHNFLQAYSVGFINDNLLKQTGRNLESIFNQGIKLTWNKGLDMNVYKGFTLYGTTGLLNNVNVYKYTASANGTANATTFASKTAKQIVANLNTLLNTVWVASEYSPDGLPNQILLPPAQFQLLFEDAGSMGYKSILEYFEANNICKANGVDLKIYPCRQCIGAGVNGSDRMVAYVNEESKVHIDVTVPLARALTAPNIANASIDSIYAGQYSEVKLNYTQTIAYCDGI